MIPLGEFLANPRIHLRKVSEAADAYRFFRETTFYGLLIGFPLVLYALLHAVFRHTLSVYGPLRRNASLCASVACFCAGLALLMPVYSSRGRPLEEDDVLKSLASDRWTDQVAALRQISISRFSPDQLAAAANLIDSPSIPVRYWLARALSASRQPESLAWTASLLRDPHPNVICMALRTFGRKRNPAATKEIIDTIERSDHWYVQWYAYRALKDTGWTQKRSD